MLPICDLLIPFLTKPNHSPVLLCQYQTSRFQSHYSWTVFLMVRGALLDDSESEASKTAITIHGENVGCSPGHEHMKGTNI